MDDRESHPPAAREVTELLHAWREGDTDALEELLPSVYTELRRMARRALARERQGHTLQPTALVHEAYFRLASQDRAQWENRSQFMGVTARLMRRVLVDHARRRQAEKRGGDRISVTLEEGVALSDSRSMDLLALDQALGRLAELDERQAKVVELRYFAGLNVEETAEALEISPRTVKREWSLARAWLRREMSRSAGGGS